MEANANLNSNSKPKFKISTIYLSPSKAIKAGDTNTSINEGRASETPRSKLSMTMTMANSSQEKENQHKHLSSSKKRLSDRFIPSSISKNLLCQFSSREIKSSILSVKPNQVSTVQALSERKSELNYQKVLESEILNESTPKFDDNSLNSKGYFDLFSVKRKLRYQTEPKRLRKFHTSKENVITTSRLESNELLSTDPSQKYLKEEKPMKVFNFENVSENFYLNNLDMYDANKIALGGKTGLVIFDGNKEMEDRNFYRFCLDSANEIYSVRFVSPSRVFFSDSSCALKIKDLNKDLEILRFEMIQRKFITMDYCTRNENVIFFGSDSSHVDFYDLRQKCKLKNLYRHENNNEVCKVRYSYQNDLLISGGNDNKICIYDLRKEKVIQTFKHKAAVKGIALNDKERIFATGGGTFDKSIKLWDLKKLELVSEIYTESQITNIEFLPDDSLVVSNGYIGNNMVLFNLNFDKITKHLLSPLKLSNINSSYASDDDNVNIFEKVSIFEKHPKRILYMAKSRCNEFITTCSTDGTVKVWKFGKFFKKSNFGEVSNFCGIR